MKNILILQIDKLASFEYALRHIQTMLSHISVPCSLILSSQKLQLCFSSLSSRILVSSWWLFVLIVVNCYTANLAAYLTINKIDSTIRSAEDLVSQDSIRFGVVKSGSSWTTLKVVKKYFNKCFS